MQSRNPYSIRPSTPDNSAPNFPYVLVHLASAARASHAARAARLMAGSAAHLIDRPHTPFWLIAAHPFTFDR